MRFHHNNSTGTTSSHRTKCHHGNILRGNCRRVMILGAVVVFTIASCLSMFNVQAPTAYARDYDAEIKALQNQIDDYNKRASELSAQADTLQGKINELQNQQASIQAQIDLSEAEKAQLEQQIADAEAKIKAQAATLGETLKTQYYSNQTSALDILMNSDSVSDYVDRQTRQQSMSDQITETVNEIKQAKADLESKKAEVEELISRQNAQKQDLADSQAEQQALLNQTQGQEDKYRELTDANNAKIEQLRKEQAEEIARRLGPRRSPDAWLLLIIVVQPYTITMVLVVVVVIQPTCVMRLRIHWLTHGVCIVANVLVMPPLRLPQPMVGQITGHAVAITPISGQARLIAMVFLAVARPRLAQSQ